ISLPGYISDRGGNRTGADRALLAAEHHPGAAEGSQLEPIPEEQSKDVRIYHFR
ncbi:hypothetical protein ASPFODRAFT_54958, partial [Aspergillus luchuensis CBS 106.47]